MRLENTVKYHSPKSQAFTDSSRATDSETLTGSDIMAALGMAQSAAPLGFSAFSGKMELSQRDKEKAIQLLTQFGLKHSGKVAALRKLDTKVRLKVVQTLAIFAFEDYCRSAASTIKCNCCKGKGILKKTKKVITHPGCGSTLEKINEQLVDEVCVKCSGRGVISTACIKCRGRGLAINRKESEYRGFPVKSTCKQCLGRGYERLPASKCYKAIKQFTDLLSPDVWDKALKPFYELIISEVEKAESEASNFLSKATRKL